MEPVVRLGNKNLKAINDQVTLNSSSFAAAGSRTTTAAAGGAACRPSLLAVAAARCRRRTATATPSAAAVTPSTTTTIVSVHGSYEGAARAAEDFVCDQWPRRASAFEEDDFDWTGDGFRVDEGDSHHEGCDERVWIQEQELQR